MKVHLAWCPRCKRIAAGRTPTEAMDENGCHAYFVQYVTTVEATFDTRGAKEPRSG